MKTLKIKIFSKPKTENSDNQIASIPVPIASLLILNTLILLTSTSWDGGESCSRIV